MIAKEIRNCHSGPHDSMRELEGGMRQRKSGKERGRHHSSRDHSKTGRGHWYWWGCRSGERAASGREGLKGRRRSTGEDFTPSKWSNAMSSGLRGTRRMSVLWCNRLLLVPPTVVTNLPLGFTRYGRRTAATVTGLLKGSHHFSAES